MNCNIIYIIYYIRNNLIIIDERIRYQIHTKSLPENSKHYKTGAQQAL